MKTVICILLTALSFGSCYETVKDRYYPRYHLAPPNGWMNDPNGFSYFQGEYHLFYQYNPFTSQSAGIAHWGHAKSVDLFHWIHLPIAIYPDKAYDRTGVFSGNVLVDNGTMYIIYTGNVNTPGGPNNMQYQALAMSTDGLHVEKYAGNPIIEAKSHQPNIRDPKFWKHEDETYYMVLGNSFNNNTQGRVLLYESKNLKNWKEVSVLAESDGSMGYMWECPDFFELDGYHVLMMSPQGVAPQGDKFKNLYQTVYVIGHFDYETLLFTPITEYREVDHGRHFYATQTTLDSRGRRLMFAWFDMWEDVLPERNDGFTGTTTLPRQLSINSDLKLIQKPVEESYKILSYRLYNGKARSRTSVQLDDNAAMVEIFADKFRDFELIFESKNKTSDVIISYYSETKHVTIYQDGFQGMRRTEWYPKGKLYWMIFLDASSIELFCGEGEVTFSNRYFPEGPITVRIGHSSYAERFTVYSINRTVNVPSMKIS